MCVYMRMCILNVYVYLIEFVCVYMRMSILNVYVYFIEFACVGVYVRACISKLCLKSSPSGKVISRFFLSPNFTSASYMEKKS